MHEYGVAASINDTVRQSAGGRTITKITLRIGDLSGIFGDSLVMYLDLILQEQQGKAAEIVIEPVSVLYRCACGNEYAPEQRFAPCPVCSGFDRIVIAGNDCTIESIEVEDE